MNKKKLIRFSLGPVGGALLGLFTLPILSWYFPPEDIGRLSMLQLTISFVLLVFSLGLDQAFVREFHEVTDKGELLKTSLLPGLLLLVVSLFIVQLLPWNLSELIFAIDSDFLFILVVIAVLLSYGVRFLSLVLRMNEKALNYSISQILQRATFLSLILFIISQWPITNFLHLILANTLSIVIVFFFVAWNTRLEWLYFFKKAFDLILLKKMLSYSLPLVVSSAAFWGLISLDKVFLRTISTFSELGVYSLSVSFAGVAVVLQSIFSVVWAPTIYKWVAEGEVDPHKVESITSNITYLILSLWSCAGMLSWILEYFLPEDYKYVPNILLVVLAYPLFYTLSEATGIGIGITRKTLYLLLTVALSLLINIILNYYLIPDFGAAGAGIATAISFFIYFLIKTESSVLLWLKIKRLKMYFFVCVLLVSSIFSNITELATILTVSINVIVFLFIQVFYRENIKHILRFVKA